MIKLIVAMYLFVGAGVGIAAWLANRADINFGGCENCLHWWGAFLLFTLIWPIALLFGFYVSVTEARGAK